MADALGIDIIEIERIAGAVAAFGDRFANRILGLDERVLLEKRTDKVQFLAGRFAAKEAIIKGLGRYMRRRPALTDIQILNDETGNPVLLLSPEIESQLKGVHCLVSISHNRASAVAVAQFSDNRAD